MNDQTKAEISGNWDYGTLPSNITVGQDCWLERKECFSNFRSELDLGIRIGDRVKIYTWSALNIEPRGYLEIGDDSIVVGAAFMCAGRIVIGKRVVISYHVTIADSDFHPRDPEQRRLDAIANAPFGDRSQRPPLVARPVLIEDDVQIGIGAIILKGVTIGSGARIGAGAVVTSDVQPHAEVIGNPARVREQQA